MATTRIDINSGPDTHHVEIEFADGTQFSFGTHVK